MCIRKIQFQDELIWLFLSCLYKHRFEFKEIIDAKIFLWYKCILYFLFYLFDRSSLHKELLNRKKFPYNDIFDFNPNLEEKKSLLFYRTFIRNSVPYESYLKKANITLVSSYTCSFYVDFFLLPQYINKYVPQV